MFHPRDLTPALGVLVVLCTAGEAGAQVEAYNHKFNSGQNIAPIFEGWSRNVDGGFTMHFGYLNRNYVEEIHVPLGPSNNVVPEGPDRGQPTFFYTRTHRYSFSVPVPKDWGRKEVIWTLTVHGKTERAVGWLQPEWEIDDDVRRRNTNANQADPENNRQEPDASSRCRTACAVDAARYAATHSVGRR